jgi:hypothetical protein
MSGTSQEVKDIEKELHELYEREEVMYRQRSRVDWLKSIDKNTKYFQNRVSHRKRKNTIKALKRADGERCTTDEEMRALAHDFYSNLYASEGVRDIESILDSVTAAVSEDMNSKLLEAFSDDEIEWALF